MWDIGSGAAALLFPTDFAPQIVVVGDDEAP